jgi:hypothetical protein
MAAFVLILGFALVVAVAMVCAIVGLYYSLRTFGRWVAVAHYRRNPPPAPDSLIRKVNHDPRR